MSSQTSEQRRQSMLRQHRKASSSHLVASVLHLGGIAHSTAHEFHEEETHLAETDLHRQHEDERKKAEPPIDSIHHDFALLGAPMKILGYIAGFLPWPMPHRLRHFGVAYPAFVLLSMVSRMVWELQNADNKYQIERMAIVAIMLMSIGIFCASFWLIVLHGIPQRSVQTLHKQAHSFEIFTHIIDNGIAMDDKHHRSLDMRLMKIRRLKDSELHTFNNKEEITTLLEHEDGAQELAEDVNVRQAVRKISGSHCLFALCTILPVLALQNIPIIDEWIGDDDVENDSVGLESTYARLGFLYSNITLLISPIYGFTLVTMCMNLFYLRVKNALEIVDNLAKRRVPLDYLDWVEAMRVATHHHYKHFKPVVVYGLIFSLSMCAIQGGTYIIILLIDKGKYPSIWVFMTPAVIYYLVGTLYAVGHKFVRSLVDLDDHVQILMGRRKDSLSKKSSTKKVKSSGYGGGHQRRESADSSNETLLKNDDDVVASAKPTMEMTGLSLARLPVDSKNGKKKKKTPRKKKGKGNKARKSSSAALDEQDESISLQNPPSNETKKKSSITTTTSSPPVSPRSVSFGGESDNGVDTPRKKKHFVPHALAKRLKSFREHHHFSIKSHPAIGMYPTIVFRAMILVVFGMAVLVFRLVTEFPDCLKIEDNPFRNWSRVDCSLGVRNRLLIFRSFFGMGIPAITPWIVFLFVRPDMWKKRSILIAVAIGYWLTVATGIYVFMIDQERNDTWPGIMANFVYFCLSLYIGFEVDWPIPKDDHHRWKFTSAFVLTAIGAAVSRLIQGGVIIPFYINASSAGKIVVVLILQPIVLFFVGHFFKEMGERIEELPHVEHHHGKATALLLIPQLLISFAGRLYLINLKSLTLQLKAACVMGLIEYANRLMAPLEFYIIVYIWTRDRNRAWKFSEYVRMNDVHRDYLYVGVISEVMAIVLAPLLSVYVKWHFDLAILSWWKVVLSVLAQLAVEFLTDIAALVMEEAYLGRKIVALFGTLHKRFHYLKVSLSLILSVVFIAGRDYYLLVYFADVKA